MFFSALFNTPIGGPPHRTIRVTAQKNLAYISLSDTERCQKLLEILESSPCRAVWENIMDLFEHWYDGNVQRAFSTLYEQIKGKEHLYLLPPEPNLTYLPELLEHNVTTLYFINSDATFYFLYRFLTKQLKCEVNIIAAKEWGETWWNFHYQGIKLCLYILYPGTELYPESPNKDLTDSETRNACRVARELSEQIAKAYNQKYKVLEKEMEQIIPFIGKAIQEEKAFQF